MSLLYFLSVSIVSRTLCRLVFTSKLLLFLVSSHFTSSCYMSICSLSFLTYLCCTVIFAIACLIMLNSCWNAFKNDSCPLFLKGVFSLAKTFYYLFSVLFL